MEERVLNDTLIKHNSTGINYIICDATETNNQFGYGVYLYSVKATNVTDQLSKGFGLYRQEFTIVSEPEERKFLVVMYTFANDHIDPIIIADTEAKAQSYIDREMNGKIYNGTGIYKILPIRVYK